MKTETEILSLKETGVSGHINCLAAAKTSITVPSEPEGLQIQRRI